MTTDDDRVQALRPEPQGGRAAAFRAERRPGETILIAPEERHPMPPGGVRVLLLGSSVPALMIHGFLFYDLPAVARLDPMADAGQALASLARCPGCYDLVLVVERCRGSTAIAFAEALSARLGPGAAHVPFVVGLADELPPEAEDRFRRSGACAAALLLPLSHAGFAALLGALYHGRAALSGA